MVDGGFGIVVMVGEEVFGDDGEAFFFEDGFPEVVFPASAAGSVDHEDGVGLGGWIGKGEEGGEKGKHGASVYSNVFS